MPQKHLDASIMQVQLKKTTHILQFEFVFHQSGNPTFDWYSIKDRLIAQESFIKAVKGQNISLSIQLVDYKKLKKIIKALKISDIELPLIYVFQKDQNYYLATPIIDKKEYQEIDGIGVVEFNNRKVLDKIKIEYQIATIEYKDTSVKQYSCRNDEQINYELLVSDFEQGFYPLSYEVLRRQLLRRNLSSSCLWVVFLKSKIPPIACYLLAKILKKNHNPLKHLQEIILGSRFSTLNRLQCLVNLKVEDDQYLLSTEIIQMMLKYALENSRLLSIFIEEACRIKLDTPITDSHYFMSIQFLNNAISYKNIDFEFCLYTREIQAYQYLHDITEQSSQLEIYLPTLFESKQYYLPSPDVLLNWVQYLTHNSLNEFIIHAQILSLIQNYQIGEYEFQDNVLYNLIYQYHQESNEVNYHRVLQQCRQLYGINRGKIQYYFEPFCHHRMSVKYHQQNNLIKAEYHQDQFVQSKLQFPLNDINAHKLYVNKPLKSVAFASALGFQMKEWFVQRFNEMHQISVIPQDEQLLEPGQILGWGQNTKYQLCQREQQPYLQPRIIQSQVMFKELCCGYKHTIALCMHGNVYCWGDNEYYKCGVDQLSQVKQPQLITSNSRQVSCGHDFSVCLKADGHVFSWGCEGLLGNGTESTTHIPQQAMIKNVTKIRCGGLHVCAIVDRKLYSWGRGDGGQLGMITHSLVPIQMDVTDIIDVACGDAHTIVLDAKGDVYGWGYSEQGQLGQMETSIKPIKIISKVQQIFGGSLCSYFIVNGSLYGCGQNDSNQLGVSFDSDKSGTVQFISKDIKLMGIGQSHVICQKKNTIIGWGLNRYGEILSSDLELEVQSIGCGGYHSLVITSGTDRYVNKFIYVDHQLII